MQGVLRHLEFAKVREKKQPEQIERPASIA